MELDQVVYHFAGLLTSIFAWCIISIATGALRGWITSREHLYIRVQNRPWMDRLSHSRAADDFGIAQVEI